MKTEEDNPFEEAFQAFFPSTGDWRESNWRSLIEMLFPGFDSQMSEDVESPRLMALLLGVLKTFVASMPTYQKAMAEVAPRLAANSAKLAELLKESDSSIELQHLNALHALSEEVEEGCSAMTEPFEQLAGIVVIMEQWAFQFAATLPLHQCAAFHRTYAEAISVSPMSAAGTMNPHAHQRRTFLVRQFLFICGELVGTQITSRKDLHKTVAALDRSGAFCRNNNDPQWDKDYKCVEDVCRRIGLNFKNRGRPKKRKSET